MGIGDWIRSCLRALREPIPTPPASAQQEWGETRDWVEGNCRIVQWSVLLDSWEQLTPIVDRFLAASVDAITTAYPREPVAWVVLRFDPLAGMLSVAPAPEPAWEEGDERVQLSLHSTLVEREAERTYNASSDGSYERLYRRFWNMVRRSLQDGESSSKFVVARQEHPLRIAAYNSPAGCDDEPVEDMGEPRASADGGRDPGS